MLTSLRALPPLAGPSRRPTFSNFVMPTPNTDDANLVDLPVSALLFAPRRHRGQVIGAAPGDHRARRVQGSELGGGQGDRQRAKVLLDACRPPGAGNRYRGDTEGLGAVPQPCQRDLRRRRMLFLG